MAEIRHIGYLALCDARNHGPMRHVHRVDLGASRYRKLGKQERFSGEAPYRVCKRCLAKIVKREKSHG